MNKNLKKVISSVIALALSVGSAAIAAPSFSDVPETASYAQAVNTLASLGVISGYAEDGTFKPDNNITRAEVTTMIVAALNRSADAEGSKGTTKFPDMNVEAKEWATGFVNIGTTEGFIKGYDDGTFKPDNNVTYAELCVMLVSIAGYGDYAEYLGGWPNGYLSVASDRGISKNVSSSADTAVTRAQVAQMIYNTLLDVPLTKSTSLEVDSNGNYFPNLETMDGKSGRDYETLLTEKHNAYYVEGYVDATNRTKPSLDANEVDFMIEYTENYDDEFVVKKGSSDAFVETVYTGETTAADNLFTYASAIIKIDDNDDPTLVSYIPSGRNSVAEFNANLIDDEDYDVFTGSSVKDGAYIRYYSDKNAARSTKYNLSEKVELYVNGVEVSMDGTNFEKYVLNNEVGTVQLIDRYSASQKTDGDYDIIFATYYATARIGSVNTTSGRIAFDDIYVDQDLRTNNITLDPEDDDIVYDIYYNGEEIELSALQTDDIISIAFDVNYKLDASSFYEIHVSRDTATGKYTRQNKDNETVLIGNTEYEFVQGYEEGIGTINMADEYTLYLDSFGRIFDVEILASSAKLAVLDRYTKASSDDYYRATLYATDGTAKSLELDTSRVDSIVIDGTTYTGGGDGETSVNTGLRKLVYVDGKSGEKNPIQDRIVEYKISSSSGRIIELSVAEAQRDTGDTTAFYKASSKSLGTIKMNDATVVIDAIDYNDSNDIPTYSDLALTSVAGFTDDGEYVAYAYGTRNNDGTYPLVLVTSGGGIYTYETNFAVIDNVGNGYDDETGDEIYTLGVYYQGDELLDAEEELIVNDDAVINGVTSVNNLQRGDIIVFAKDGNNRIKQIDVLATAAELNIGSDKKYSDFYTSAIAATEKIDVPAGANNWTGEWFKDVDNEGDNLNSSKEITRIVFGPIVDKSTNFFTLGNIANGTVNVEKTDGTKVDYTGLYTNLYAGEVAGGTLEIDIDGDTNVYTYNFGNSSSTRLQLGSRADIVATTLASSLLFNGGDFIPWKGDVASIAAEEGVTFAFAKVVEGTATDVFVIYAN